MAMKTTSEEWREKGNNSYLRVDEGLAPSVQVTRLQEAVNCYGQALSTATNNNEKSSACKNLAMAYWKMAKAQAVNGSSSSIISFNYKSSLSHFQDSRDYGRQRDVGWHDSLKDAATRCWYDVTERLKDWEAEERVREMEQVVGYILDNSTKARSYLEIVHHYFYWSVTSLGERDYRECLTLLRDCHFPLEEAKRFCRLDPLLTNECDILEEDIFIQNCVAESIQERMRGEALMNHVIRDEEVLNIDIVWDVVDSFRLAAQLTRDRDLEMEAMALSALGHVYDQVLKLKSRAKECLKKVLELASTMVPRNFTGEDWYEFARSTLERYQQEQVHQEEEQHQKETQEVRQQIKDVLDTLKKKHTDCGKVEFLKFIYTTHPPKNPEHKMAEVSKNPEFAELKKLYQRAVIHYHPDKVNVEEHGKTWKVLTEEITKLLTSHYEYFKGCS